MDYSLVGELLANLLQTVGVLQSRIEELEQENRKAQRLIDELSSAPIEWVRKKP